MKSKIAIKITAEDIADLVEFSVNETKPKLRTKRGTGGNFTVSVGRRTFTVTVEAFRKPKRVRKIINETDTSLHLQ